MIAVLLLLATQLTPPPRIVPAPSDASASAEMRRLGDGFEAVGQCRAVQGDEMMNRSLRIAESDPVLKPYLIKRLGQGLRAPMDAAWCTRRFAQLGRDAQAREKARTAR